MHCQVAPIMGRLVIIIGCLGLFIFGSTAECPREANSPGREIVCYTSIFDVKRLEHIICKCTTLIHQGHDIQSLTTTGIANLRKSLKKINPVLQIVVSVNDAQGTLKTSANARQEAIARIFNIINEVEGIELNVTAGTKERLVHFVRALKDEMTRNSKERRILVQLPTKAEELAKQFDIKGLSKFVDLFTLPTHYLTDNNDKYKTFHPSRLMGLFDLLNTDSLVDLVHGLGATKRKILITLPVSGYKFILKIKDKNAVGDSTEQAMPYKISRGELCNAFLKGAWTIERDEDLTAPYAFKDNIWVAFEDKISVGIKGKYVLLRDLAGVGISDVENDLTTDCGKTLIEYIYQSFTNNKRQSREAVLTSLQDDIYNTEISYPDNLKSSNFRISRVVDVKGKIHAIRENTQTEFSCSRQGYFVHPKSCNRFYRCVKFNQAIENYSVFEFDCPAGLAFDESTEVCVWPGSLAEGSPCPGSPEIAPTAPRRFQCPGHGYYADPQNCRWFFACIDLGEGKMMAYEFQCPFGLVFDEQKLVCEWPWLVPECAGRNYEHNGILGYGGEGGTSSINHYGHGIDGSNVENNDGIYKNHPEPAYDDHGGYDKTNNGNHGEGSYNGYDDSGHGVQDGYDYTIKGEGDQGFSHGGHRGYDIGPSDGDRGGHRESTQGSQDGYDHSKNDEHEDGFSSSRNESGHGGQGEYDHPIKGGHDQESSDRGHGEHEKSGHNGYDGYDDGSSNVPESHDESGLGNHHGYDEPTDDKHTKKSSHNGPGELGHNGHGMHEVSGQEGHGEYDQSNEEHYNNRGHDESGYGRGTNFGEHDSENGGSNDGNYAHGSDGDNKGQHDKAHREESLNNGHTKDHEESEHGGHDNKYDREYEGASKNGDAVNSSHWGHEVHGVKTHFQDNLTTNTYVTSPGHSTSSYDRFLPSNGAQHTTVDGVNNNKYPGPPTIIIESDNSHYTTAGQTYRGSNKDQSIGQDQYTGGNINFGVMSSSGVAQTSFGVTTTHPSHSSTHRGDTAITGGFHKGVKNYESSILKSGVHEGNNINGITQPEYIQTQTGTSGYVVTKGVKTIYDGSTVPQTLLYDTTKSGIYNNRPESTQDSQFKIGNGYYTKEAKNGHTTSVGSKGGAIFTSGGNTISTGNQYYTNQAGTSYTGITRDKDHNNAYIPTISTTGSENDYYNGRKYNHNIVTSGITDFTPAVSVTSSGNRYYTNQAGSSSSNSNREVLIKSMVTSGYKTNEYHDNGGRGTIRYNNGVVTHKYTEDDVKDHRTSFRIPSTTDMSQSDIFTTFPGGVYTREGFTKTGPTKTGITTAQLGGTGTYVVGVSTIKPSINNDEIGENAFKPINKQNSNINKQKPNTITYSYEQPIKFDHSPSTQSAGSYGNRNIPTSSQSPFFNVQVYNTPTVLPSAPTTASPVVFNTYSYANPTNVQYQENMYQSSKSSSDSASTGQYSNPFFNARRKHPTVAPTVEPIGYTALLLDNYETTEFEAARIPIAVSTVKPIMDNNYKTALSSSSIPVSPSFSVMKDYDYVKNEDLTEFDKITGDQLLNVGVSFEQPSAFVPVPTNTSGYSRQPSRHNSNEDATPSIIYHQSTIEKEQATGSVDCTDNRANGGFGQKINHDESLSKDSIPYQQPTPNIPLQFHQTLGTKVPHQSRENYKNAASAIEDNVENNYNYPVPNKKFIKPSTPTAIYSTIRISNPNILPVNPLTGQSNVQKLVNNYNNRGSVKYIPQTGFESNTRNGYDNYKSSNQIATFSHGNTTPRSKVSIHFGNYKGISTTLNDERNNSNNIGHMRNNEKIIVKFSDLHPILLGKLSAECTCKVDPFTSFRGSNPLTIDSSKGKIDLKNYDESDVYVDLGENSETELHDDQKDLTNYQSSTPPAIMSIRQTPIVAIFNGVKSSKIQSRQPLLSDTPSTTPCAPSLHYLPSTTSSSLRVLATDIEANTPYSSEATRSRRGKSIRSYKANTLLPSKKSLKRMNSGEIGVLEMSTDSEAKCARPGLFRHPKFCNKFYICHWDEWRKKFALHIFNCPIHLTFDNHASACNWPSKGPACQDDNILV